MKINWYAKPDGAIYHSLAGSADDTAKRRCYGPPIATTDHDSPVTPAEQPSGKPADPIALECLSRMQEQYSDCGWNPTDDPEAYLTAVMDVVKKVRCTTAAIAPAEQPRRFRHKDDTGWYWECIGDMCHFVSPNVNHSGSVDLQFVLACHDWIEQPPGEDWSKELPATKVRRFKSNDCGCIFRYEGDSQRVESKGTTCKAVGNVPSLSYILANPHYYAELPAQPVVPKPEQPRVVELPRCKHCEAVADEDGIIWHESDCFTQTSVKPEQPLGRQFKRKSDGEIRTIHVNAIAKQYEESSDWDEVTEDTAPAVATVAEPSDCRCRDCGSPEPPIDTVLTGLQWEIVCPDGGILCASCIVKRAAKLPHVVDVVARIQFVNDYESHKPGGRYWQLIKTLETDLSTPTVVGEWERSEVILDRWARRCEKAERDLAETQGKLTAQITLANQVSAELNSSGALPHLESTSHLDIAKSARQQLAETRAEVKELRGDVERMRRDPDYLSVLQVEKSNMRVAISKLHKLPIETGAKWIVQANDAVDACFAAATLSGEPVVLAIQTDLAETRADLENLRGAVAKLPRTMDAQSRYTQTEVDRIKLCHAAAKPGSGKPLTDELDKLRTFKQYTHDALDKMGVAADSLPDETAQHGCRMGSRMKWLSGELARLREKSNHLEEIVNDAGPAAHRLITERAKLREENERLTKERMTGLCSAHQHGEDKSCPTCYPWTAENAMLRQQLTQAEQRIKVLSEPGPWKMIQGNEISYRETEDRSEAWICHDGQPHALVLSCPHENRDEMVRFIDIDELKRTNQAQLFANPVPQEDETA